MRFALTVGLFLGVLFSSLPSQVRAQDAPAPLNLRPFTFEEWVEIEPLVAVVCMNMIVPGEGANQLSTDLKAKEPEVPWEGMIGMRNRGSLTSIYGSI